MSETFLYFTYGSNMLSKRLKKRCPSAEFYMTAQLPSYTLDFTKKSIDGSGKATIVSGQAGDICHGAVFELSNDDEVNLDSAEGSGYCRQKVEVLVGDQKMQVQTYIAKKTESGLNPYNWYLALIVAGAQEHGLPADRISALRSVPFDTDPEPERTGQLEAIEALNAAIAAQVLAGHTKWEDLLRA